MGKKDGLGGWGLGDLFKDLGNLLEIIDKMEDMGCNEMSKTGEFGSPGPKGLKGTYGFSIRTSGLGRPMIQPFGNVRAGAGKVEFDETWEPILDVFDEQDHVLVVAELPGISEDQLELKIEDDHLQLRASGLRQYKKNIPLPYAVDENKIVSVLKNGIVEITLPKKSDQPE
ncbi:Hsp20/alpha crystallin family protein [Candidatus Formimonas warabiya]|uniref:SHSP domain-containing protein n=1 Tax=Formimonas warabiya TaxID=1761012 RepID=A0A3G1KVG1_FORW1|nr:Hsp20/alpha crystallin family protein [Candidatus Formimonas warabiya]ATW26432.1 hypothetical protein DCMF_18245 [Candidatus Formimonas warabiya]